MVSNVSEATFQREVIDESFRRPVLVDFWAEWCGPCRQLGPVLEKLADEADGAWKLAKIDTDANQSIARSFGISGIPAVKAFVDGEVVAEFVGAKSRGQVEEFLGQLVVDPVDALSEEGGKALGRNDLVAARAAFEEALAAKPHHGRSHLGLAMVGVLSGDADFARAHLEAMQPGDRAALATEVSRLELALEAVGVGSEDALRARLATDGSDHEARLALGALLATRDHWEQAFEAWFAVFQADRGEHRTAAREAMVRGFQALGRTPVADKWQRKLTMALY